MATTNGNNGSPPQAPPAEVAELAAACIVYVERATKVTLDYTPETLPLLDHYVHSMRKELGTKDEILALVAAPVGAYLGEVMRRMMPLGWFAPPGEYRRWRIELEDVFLSMNPVGAAVEALLLQEAEGWGASFRMRAEDEPIAQHALANLPEVEEEEYFAPSSRVEVLSIVADALWAHDVAEGTTRKYAAADYGPVRAEAIGEALGSEGGDG